MITTINILTPSSDQELISITGDPVRGAGWYGPTNGLHTVSINVQNFRGRIGVQATLATNPLESDWFSVLPNNVAYIEYPQPQFVIISPSNGETSTFGFNFSVNAVWVRAFMDRSYFVSSVTSPAFIALFGRVGSILLSYGNTLGNFNYNKQWELQ